VQQEHNTPPAAAWARRRRRHHARMGNCYCWRSSMMHVVASSWTFLRLYCIVSVMALYETTALGKDHHVEKKKTTRSQKRTSLIFLRVMLRKSFAPITPRDQIQQDTFPYQIQDYSFELWPGTFTMKTTNMIELIVRSFEWTSRTCRLVRQVPRYRRLGPTAP
jgi:hypothetical protein